ncbi:flagellar assembly protein FliW [Saccharibacillus qingshengii]|uniref:flagellar assembly protein FliW n=1 Tax=Saccharibacillus qingshengii TaxID=1763540 RepID=UPI00155328D7|nr:flagellar assembly protein FliW [Saccharibacillus qingshengii]
MIIETSAWGSKEITVEQIYRFEKGIPGFEDETEFALLPMEDGPFFYLQSLKQGALSFLLTDPFIFFPAYEFELGTGDAAELGIGEHIFVRCIVTLHEEIEQSSMNILAPIVFNPSNRKSKQVVLHNSAYQTRYPLWAADTTQESASIEGGL